MRQWIGICTSESNWEYASIGSGNGLSLVQCQAIIGTNAGVFSIGLIETDFNEIWIVIRETAFENVVCQNGGNLAQGEMS